LRKCIIAFYIILASCSTSSSLRESNDFQAIRMFEPYSLEISAKSPQVRALLKEYLIIDLNHYLQIEDKGKGKIEVFFTSHDQENQFSKWQNSTMLMVIKNSAGKRLWTGEYNYKGGLEMTSFTVNSPVEAAKLVSERIVKKLVSDYSL